MAEQVEQGHGHVLFNDRLVLSSLSDLGALAPRVLFSNPPDRRPGPGAGNVLLQLKFKADLKGQGQSSLPQSPSSGAFEDEAPGTDIREALLNEVGRCKLLGG